MFRKALTLVGILGIFCAYSVQAKQVDPNFSGEYWFGSLSADANSWVPWGKVGTVIINGNNWHQEWEDYDGHHSFSGTFTTSVQPDGSININHAWGSYNVAWNGNIMINADTAPDAENHLGFDIIARKAANVDVNDVVGNYSFFAHWSDWYERDASVGWELFKSMQMVMASRHGCIKMVVRRSKRAPGHLMM